MTENLDFYARMKQAATYLRGRAPKFKPKVASVLGSGLGIAAESITEKIEIPFSEIPHFKTGHIPGHSKKMIFGYYKNTEILLIAGRLHPYEGFSARDVVLPIYVARELGIESILLTNAAGGLHAGLKPGDFLLIEDQINMTGLHPTFGPHEPAFGPRFLDASELYSSALRERISATAASLSLSLQKGVYLGLLGPSFETPAEVRMYRNMGGDVVGMSTVLEAIAANGVGMKVGGISLVTNLGPGVLKTPSHQNTHEEVLAQAAQSGQNFAKLLLESLQSLQK